MKSVFLIAIVAVAIIGVMVPSVFTLNEAHAEMIQGDNIRKNTPYGCLLSDVNTSNKQNQITVKFNAYTRSPDISVVIQMDGKTKFIQQIPKQNPTKISETFSISEQNSHNLGICLQKSWPDIDERMLDITNVKFTTTKITPPSTPSTPTPSTPTPSTPTIEKSIDCTLKQKPQFDRDYEYGSNWEISIVNPHPNNCKYEVKIYDSAKNYQGVVDKKLISSLGITFTGYSDGEYFILLKSITDGKLYGYYPLTIVDKTTPIDPTIILIVIGVVAVGIIAVAVSKRKKGDSTTEHEPRPDQPPPGALPKIDVHEFVKKCEGGTEEDMFTIMKRKCSDENYRKILQTLLGDLNKINADDGIKMIVLIEISTIPGQPKIPKIPKRPDAPRLSNASTTTQPLKVIVNWTAPNDGGSEITSYDLYRSGMEGQRFAAIQKNIQGLTFTDTLPSEGTWHYDVMATNSIGSSPPSLAASITVRSGDPPHPHPPPTPDVILSSKDPYAILGISQGASESEIKIAYRKLFKKNDPNFGIVNRTKSEQEVLEKIATKLNWAKEQLKRK
jgi:DnaJ-domain-containing protein 1